MTRELLIMRHAKSDWATGAQSDFERPLAKRGRRASKKMAVWLRDQGLLPDRVVCSTAERARQTVLRVCRFTEIPESAIVWEPRIYEAGLETLLDVLREAPPDSHRLMIVGHNPGLDDLVRYLADDSLAAWDAANLMPTAAVARLSMPNSWSSLERGTAEVASIGRPRELFDD